MLATGFLANSTNQASYALAKPAILKVANGMSGEAKVTLSTQSIVRSCEVRSALVDDEGKPGEFLPSVVSTSSRNITVPNLIPGRLYLHQGRTIGGTTTFSDWSDPTVQRAN